MAPSTGGRRTGFSGHKLIQLLLLIFDGTANAVSSSKWWRLWRLWWLRGREGGVGRVGGVHYCVVVLDVVSVLSGEFV